MIRLIMLAQIAIHVIAIPMYFVWFYLIYYMIFKDFKVGAVLFGACIAFGYVLLFVKKMLSSYQLRLYARTDSDEA